MSITGFDEPKVKWCGYCGNYITPIINDFIHHIHECEMYLCEKIREDKKDK
jgi:hypothetical protein